MAGATPARRATLRTVMPGVADGVDLLLGGLHQQRDHLGLAWRQPPPGGLGARRPPRGLRAVAPVTGDGPARGPTAAQRPRVGSGMWGVPSRMGGKSKVAAVVILVMVVISASGSVSFSSSMVSSHRQ